MLDAEDATDIGDQLEVNSSAALIVFENTWAARFASAVTASGGESSIPSGSRLRSRRPIWHRHRGIMGLLGTMARTA